MTFYIHGRIAAVITCILSGFIVSTAFGSVFDHSKIILQAGAFRASQGNVQDIGIQGLIGNHYTVNHSYANNALLGLGYYLEGLDNTRWNILYGVDAFYFAPTAVQGNIIQEQYSTGLSYQYSITNYPVYAAAKASLKSNVNYNLTFDVGVGPNIIQTYSYHEYSLDGGFTIPDNAFAGQTTVALSAMVGFGIKFNHVLGHLPVELGYRYFYLGQSKLKKVNDQYERALATGYNYANALIISVAF